MEVKIALNKRQMTVKLKERKWDFKKCERCTKLNKI
jgi:hypothetical protein